jgi:large subunit ribosomal protein L6
MTLANNIKDTLFFSQVNVNLAVITIFKKGNLFFLKGPLGVLNLNVPTTITIKRVDSTITVFGKFYQKALILTFLKLLIQTLRGVEFGFFDTLVIKGVGWRVFLEQKNLKFTLGYSHTVKYSLPKGIEVIIFDKQNFKVFGLNLKKVRQTVSDLSQLRKVDVYKGKGVYSQTHPLLLKISSKSKS